MSHSPTSPSESRESFDSALQQLMELINTGGSWSGHERNCCFLNISGGQFADTSAVTGLDFLDDGRAIAPVDWDLDGDLDLWLSARTGPRLRLVRNDSRNAANAEGGKHYLAVKLVGTDCNRDAIGAQIEVVANGKTLLRNLRAGEGYLAQGTKWIHFGLGDTASIDRLSVRWPGGVVEEFQGVRPDARFELVQGQGQATEWQPPERQVALEPSQLDVQSDATPNRIVLYDRIPLPTLDYEDFQDRDASVKANMKGPLLVNLWATWCQPCLVELRDIKENEQRLRERGIDIVALSVDGLGSGDASEMANARQYMQRAEFPFRTGAANAELLSKLDACQDVFIALRTQKGQIPFSLLLDRHGRIAVIYRGATNVEQLLADVELLNSLEPAARETAFPFSGRWLAPPHEASEVLVKLAEELNERGHTQDALHFSGLAADLASRSSVPPKLMSKLAVTFFAAGNASIANGDLDDARRHYTSAIQLRPDWPEAHTNLGSVYDRLNAGANAERHYQIALANNPRLPQANFNLGAIRLKQHDDRGAAYYFQVALQVNPEFAEAHNYLGVALARLGMRGEAIQHLENALRLAPANTNAQQNLDAVLSGTTP